MSGRSTPTAPLIPWIETRKGCGLATAKEGSAGGRTRRGTSGGRTTVRKGTPMRMRRARGSATVTRRTAGGCFRINLRGALGVDGWSDHGLGLIRGVVGLRGVVGCPCYKRASSLRHRDAFLNCISVHLGLGLCDRGRHVIRLLAREVGPLSVEPLLVELPVSQSLLPD